MREPALKNVHAEMGATFADFGGVNAPVKYAGIIEEYTAVRNGAGIFDLSAYSMYTITGDSAYDLLDSFSCTDISDLKSGKSAFVVFTNERGGVINAFTAYPAPGGILIALHPTSAATTIDYLKGKFFDVNIIERGHEYVFFSLHGNREAKEILRRFKAPGSLVYARENACGMYLLDGQPCVTAMTRALGERGYDLFVPRLTAANFWYGAIRRGASPCGMAAYEMLRVEAATPRFGCELTESISPVDAGLGAALNFRKGYPGRDALKERFEHPKRKPIGLFSPIKDIFETGQAVYIGGVARGEVTSGTVSPGMNGSVALAVADINAEGEAEVGYRGKRRGAEIVPLPFTRNPA